MKKGLLALLLGLCISFTACNGAGGVNSSFDSSSTDFSQESSQLGSSSLDDSSSEDRPNSSQNSSSDKDSSSVSSSADKDDSSSTSSASSSENSSQNSAYEDSSSSEDASSSDDSTGAECDGEHVDDNDNGECDECGVSVLAVFDFYVINDIHGKMVDGDSQPGVDELTTYLKNARAANPNTVFLSSGDTWQGMSESNLTQGFILTEWMNAMGFVSMTLGNHEYDWGEEAVIANAELANFPMLAINVYDSTTNQLESYCQPSVMVEQNGVKIGIIGAIGDCYSSIASDKSAGFYFKTGDALTELVKAESDRLRAAGADFIVYSLHDGNGSSGSGNISDVQLSAYYDIELSKGYVDVVFEGHSHQNYVFRDSEGVYHMQGGGDNDGLSHAQFEINFANESYTVVTTQFVSTSVYENLPSDPLVEEILKKYEDKVAIASKVVGYNDKYRSSTELTDLVAQLYYEIGVETWGDEYDIVLGGGFLQARSPYDLGVGEITYGMLQGIFPFDNQIVLCRVSGAKLKSQFLESTNSRYHIYYDSYGAEVKQNVQTNGTYYLVTDTYTSTYAYNGLTEVARLDETTFARDLLAEYAEKGGFGEKTEMKITPLTQILSIGNALSDNETTSKVYYVQGRVTDVQNTKFGNIYIEDQNGNELYLYGLYDSTGSVRYDALAEKPQVGDIIVVSGGVTRYVTYSGAVTIENKNACLQSISTEWLPETDAETPDSGDEDSSFEDLGDPYANMTAEEFYANYTVATSAQDAYYRSLHGFMSGELTVPDQAPTLSDYQPQTSDGTYVRNIQMEYSANGLAYHVFDAYGEESFVVYKGGGYITLEEVAAYVYAFGEPPANYSSNKKTDPDDSIWGEYLRVNHTVFTGNTSKYPYEPELPNISGCGGSLTYYEMDIGTTGTDCDPSYDAELYNDGHTITRGAARIVYGKTDLDRDGVYEAGEFHVFYTYNHYNDFQEYLNYEGGWGEIFGNITGGGTISSKYDYNPTDYEDVYMGYLGEEVAAYAQVTA